ILCERIFYIGGEKLDFRAAVKRALFHQRGGVIVGRGFYKADACPNPFSVCMVKAEYHKKINAIRLLHLIETVDVGTPINPLTVEGQIEAARRRSRLHADGTDRDQQHREKAALLRPAPLQDTSLFGPAADTFVYRGKLRADRPLRREERRRIEHGADSARDRKRGGARERA
ncbi:MAG: molybdopterin cofactor-binding domain-containing protein, partial [Cloacibacillus evryensis]